jgi:hypothetical protein
MTTVATTTPAAVTATTTNSIQCSSIGVYQSAGSTAKVPNIKAAHENKHNTITIKTQNKGH